MRYSGGVFIAPVASFGNEFFAYMMFQHYRTSRAFVPNELLMSYHSGKGSEARYDIVLVLSNDLAAGVRRVASLYVAGRIPRFEWKLVSDRDMRHQRTETQLFVSAYNLPIRRRFEELSSQDLRRLIQHFIRYKSMTDPRVRGQNTPAPAPLGSGEALTLAGDIVAVAEFYDLPLELFLGIGAMENNYMNIRGDLENTAWKRRPAKDDVILERRRGRVRVLNDSAGIWQITRETLRYAHGLFIKDDVRDYCRLPERLRPAKVLNVNNVSPDVLTTYAGLLLRDLLDYFNGDLALAIGAYNGGRDHPNLRYEQGVQAVAAHARSILEHAAVLNGNSVMRTQWLTRSP